MLRWSTPPVLVRHIRNRVVESVHRGDIVEVDATGRMQPDTPPWNVGGYANNAVQRVTVTVTAA